MEKKKKEKRLFIRARDAISSKFQTIALRHTLRNDPNPILEEFLELDAEDLNPPLINGKPEIRKEYLNGLRDYLFKIKESIGQKLLPQCPHYLDKKTASKIPFAQKVQDLMQKVVSLEYYLKSNGIDPKELIIKVEEIQTLLDPTCKWIKKRGDTGGGGNAGSGMMASNLNPSALSESEHEAIKKTQEHRFRKIKVSEDKKTIKITTIEGGVITFKTSECPKNLLSKTSESLGIKLQALYMEDTKTIFQKDAELIEINSDEAGNIVEKTHKVYENLPIELKPIVDYIKTEEKKKKKEDYEMGI